VLRRTADLEPAGLVGRADQRSAGCQNARHWQAAKVRPPRRVARAQRALRSPREGEPAPSDTAGSTAAKARRHNRAVHVLGDPACRGHGSGAAPGDLTPPSTSGSRISRTPGRILVLGERHLRHPNRANPHVGSRQLRRETCPQRFDQRVRAPPEGRRTVGDQSNHIPSGRVTSAACARSAAGGPQGSVSQGQARRGAVAAADLERQSSMRAACQRLQDPRESSVLRLRYNIAKLLHAKSNACAKIIF
jgi:hypothetical protein